MNKRKVRAFMFRHDIGSLVLAILWMLLFLMIMGVVGTMEVGR